MIPTGFCIHRKQTILPTEIDRLFSAANHTATLFCDAFRKKFKQNISQFQPIYNQEWISQKIDEIKEQKNRFWNSLGTLGGGNHFIELAKDETGVFGY